MLNPPIPQHLRGELLCACNGFIRRLREEQGCPLTSTAAFLESSRREEHASHRVLPAPAPSLCTQEAGGQSAPAKQCQRSPGSCLTGVTGAMNQAGARYNLLYLVTSDLFPYLSLGRGGRGAICLLHLEPAAKKMSVWIYTTPCPSPARPVPVPAQSSESLPHLLCPFLHLPTSSPAALCHCWPRDRKNQRLLSSYVHILSVTRSTWTDGVLAPELCFTVFEYEGGWMRDGMESAQEAQRESPVFRWGRGVIVEGLRSQGPRWVRSRES